MLLKSCVFICDHTLMDIEVVVGGKNVRRKKSPLQIVLDKNINRSCDK